MYQSIEEIRKLDPMFFSQFAERRGVYNPRAIREVIAGQYFIVGYEPTRGSLRQYDIFRVSDQGRITEPIMVPHSSIEIARRHCHWHAYEYRNR